MKELVREQVLCKVVTELTMDDMRSLHESIRIAALDTAKAAGNLETVLSKVSDLLQKETK